MVTVNYKPMLISLVIIFLVGGILPAIINGFAPDTQPNHNTSLIEGFTKYFRDGVCFPRRSYSVDNPEETPLYVKQNDMCLNPNNIVLSESSKVYLINSLEAFGYLPEIVSTPLLILIIFGVAITSVTLGIAILTLIPFIG